MRLSLALLAPLGVAAGFGLALLAGRPAPAAPGDQRIAVVDILKVLNEAPQKKVIDDRRIARLKELDAAAEKADKDLRAKRNELIPLARGSDVRRQKEAELVRAKAMADADAKIREQQAVDEYTNLMEGLYKDVEFVVQTVAREQGFSLVINKSTEPFNLSTPSLQDFVMNVVMRPAVYADPTLDLTPAVSQRMLQNAPKVPPAPGTTQPGGGPPPAPPPSGPVPPGTVPPSGPR